MMRWSPRGRIIFCHWLIFITLSISQPAECVTLFSDHQTAPQPYIKTGRVYGVMCVRHGCHGLWVFVMSMLSCYLLVLISLFVFYAPVFSCDACLGFYGSLLWFLWFVASFGFQCLEIFQQVLFSASCTPRLSFLIHTPDFCSSLFLLGFPHIFVRSLSVDRYNAK